LDVEAYILIGGRSTRFGSDNAFFEFEGESLAARALGIVETAFQGIHATFVAASQEQFGIKIVGLQRPVIFDLRKGFGAWSGLDAALSRSSAEWTLVMACDLPFVTREFLLRLADATEGQVDAVVPRQEDGRLQPLCALYRTEKVRPAVQEMIGKGSVPPLTSIFEHVRSTIVDAEPDVLTNVNTPADLI